jgi:NAD(P)-dependent dehydrogenase (short-subunit alcohol dehydrogenase family)
MTQVVVVIGAGLIGVAIARRVSAGKRVLLADLREDTAKAAAKVLDDAGFAVSTTAGDISNRDSVHALVETATALGDVWGAAGVSPSQAPPAVILAVDLYGTALLLEEFGKVIVEGGSGIVIASQSGHRLHALTAEEDAALATTPVEELLSLPMLQPEVVTDPLNAYQIAKRANALRVKAEAVKWVRRGARVNTISPGIIMTPLANDELSGPRGEGYRRMIELSPAGRAGTPDEVGVVGELLMGCDGAFITGSDILMDGGVTAYLVLRRTRSEVIDGAGAAEHVARTQRATTPVRRGRRCASSGAKTSESPFPSRRAAPPRSVSRCSR